MPSIPTDTVAKAAFQDSLFHDGGLFAQRTGAAESFDEYLKRAGGREVPDAAESPAPPPPPVPATPPEPAPAPIASSRKSADEPRGAPRQAEGEKPESSQPQDGEHCEQSGTPRSEPATKSDTRGEATAPESQEAKASEPKDKADEKKEGAEPSAVVVQNAVQNVVQNPKAQAEANKAKAADIDGVVAEGVKPAATGEDGKAATQVTGKMPNGTSTAVAAAEGRQDGALTENSPTVTTAAVETPATADKPTVDKVAADAREKLAMQAGASETDNALLSADAEKGVGVRRRAASSRRGASEGSAQADSREVKSHGAADTKAAAKDAAQAADAMPTATVQPIAESPQGAVQLSAATGVPSPAVDAGLKAAVGTKSSTQSSVEATGSADGRTQPGQRSSLGESGRSGAAAQAQAGADTGAADRARFVQRVAGAFRSMGDQGGAVRLKLSPPELGSLRMEVTVRNGVMNARIEAESEAARNLLLENLPVLRERLAAQDIKVQQFQVDLRNPAQGNLAQQGGNPSFGEHRGGGQTPYPRVKAVAERVSATEPSDVRRGLEGSRLNVIV